MLAGVGGFRAGLGRVGGFQCVGHCEIDKYVDVNYRVIHDIREEERCYPDARKIGSNDLPDSDLLCGGSPCQAFSSAGRRKGFENTRGTLFSEITRPAQARQPACPLLEDVPGLLTHDQGQAFPIILATLNDPGHRVGWMVFNSADFRVPQARKWVFIVGYPGPRCAGKVPSVFGTGRKALIQALGGPRGSRVHDPGGIAYIQTAGGGGKGVKTGLYLMEPDTARSCFMDLYIGKSTPAENARYPTARYSQTILCNHCGECSGVLLIKEATKRGYKEATMGNTIDLGYAGSNTRRGHVGYDIAHILKTSYIQGIVERDGCIRCLVPRENLRPQGFAEEQTDKIPAFISDAQVCRQAGNSVTVTATEAIGRRILTVDEEPWKMDDAV